MNNMYDPSAHAPKSAFVRETEKIAAVVGFIGSLLFAPWMYSFVQEFLSDFIGEMYGNGYASVGVTFAIQCAFGYVIYVAISKATYWILLGVACAIAFAASKIGGGFGSSAVPAIF